MDQFRAMLDATMKYSQTQLVGDWKEEGVKYTQVAINRDGGKAYWETKITLNEDADTRHLDPYNQLMLEAWSQVAFMRRPGGTMDARKEDTPSDEEVYSWIPIIVQLNFTWPDALSESDSEDFDWDRAH